MKNFLVCTDGSPYSQVCCEYAAWFAKKTKAKLNVVYASELNPLQNPLWADLGGSLGIDPFQDFSSKIELIEKEKVKLIEKSVSSILKKAKLPTKQYQFHHRYSQLVDVVDEFETNKSPADIVLLGKRGENADLAKGHLGSSLERVVRASTKPCLVTSRAFRPIKSIALATDGSESVQHAISFLKSTKMFKETSVHILSVDSTAKEKKADECITKAQKALQRTYKKITTKRLTGAIEAKISSYIARNKIDLLVMGAYGHGRIRNLLIGSTTTHLVQLCKVPVLLFR